MTGTRRSWLLAALVVAVLALAGSVAGVAVWVGRAPAVTSGPAGAGGGARYGPGMMGGAGGGMMGAAGAWQTGGRYGLAGDGQAVTTLAAARVRAQAFADQLGNGLRAGEVMQFANGYYTLHTLKDGRIVGMMSVNAAGGGIWYHTWHGTFIAMAGE